MTDPSERLHLAVALDGAGWHPAAWREPTPGPTELFTAGYWVDLVREAERGLLDFVTIEDSLRPAVRRPRSRPDDRTDQVRGRLDAVLIAARVAPLTAAHRAGPDGDRHPHRAVPRLQGDRHARLRQHAAGPACGSRSRPRPARPRTSAAATCPALDRRRTSTEPAVQAAGRRAVRRGRRLRRGGAPAVGQLGGRRRDPRRRHRPLHRPGQAALHRLRGPLVLGQGPVDHAPAAAGPAARHRAGARDGPVPSSPPAPPTSCFVTPHDAADAPADRRRDPRPSSRPPGGPARPCTSSPTCGLPRRRPRAGARRARPGSTSWPARRTPATRAIFAGTAAELADLLAGLAAPPGSTGFRLRPARCRDDLDRDRSTAWCPSCSAAALFRTDYEAEHAARPARPRPPGQPLRAA